MPLGPPRELHPGTTGTLANIWNHSLSQKWLQITLRKRVERELGLVRTSCDLLVVSRELGGYCGEQIAARWGLNLSHLRSRRLAALLFPPASEGSSTTKISKTAQNLECLLCFVLSISV